MRNVIQIAVILALVGLASAYREQMRLTSAYREQVTRWQAIVKSYEATVQKANDNTERAIAAAQAYKTIAESCKSSESTLVGDQGSKLEWKVIR